MDNTAKTIIANATRRHMMVDVDGYTDTGQNAFVLTSIKAAVPSVVPTIRLLLWQHARSHGLTMVDAR